MTVGNRRVTSHGTGNHVSILCPGSVPFQVPCPCRMNSVGYWQQQEEKGEIIPTTMNSMKAAWKHAHEDAFPNMRVFLIIGCILPITSAETECSFSLCRRLKTHLRNRMTDSRLSSLVVLTMHLGIHWPRYLFWNNHDNYSVLNYYLTKTES